ncbi:DnaJ domain-containing protein [Halomonas sp. HMF6819]|uniref:J domain-containing protein n=1 Tax=Halomonas sp. HMF6819 TaxID=3373085 RepID=UPI00378F3099
MSAARFSRFERVLIESRSRVDTAALLLLAWVLCKRPELSPTQRLQRLARAGAQFRHATGLKQLLEIAGEQDVSALQLAAEVVRDESTPARRLTILQQAIGLATDDGALSPSNHYVLRFLADVLAFDPTALATLFSELTGHALTPAEDISRSDYWLREDAAFRQAQAERARAEQQAEQQRAREREKAREKAEQANEQARRERERHERASRSTPDPSGAYKSRRALAVLGLSPGATREEIRRAYRRLAQLHHPDRAYAKSEHHVALASQRFQRIKNAYDYLIKAST